MASLPVEALGRWQEYAWAEETSLNSESKRIAQGRDLGGAGGWGNIKTYYVKFSKHKQTETKQREKKKAQDSGFYISLILDFLNTSP